MENKNFENLFMERMTPSILDYMYDSHGSGSIIVIDNVKEYIDLMDIDYATSFGYTFKENPKSKEFQVVCSFNGYDKDPREVYEIKEIVEYTKKVFELAPYLFYFLCNESRRLITIIHSVEKVGKRDSVNTQIGISKNKASEFLNKMLEATYEVSHITEEERDIFIEELNKMF